MKALISIFAAAIVAGLSSSAHADQVRFRGSLTFTKVTNCQFLYAGDTFSATFRPASTPRVRLGDNLAVTSLSHFGEFGGDIYELNGPFVLNSWQKLEGNGISNEHYSFPATLRITSQTPARIAANTEFVTFTGLLSRASDDPGVDGKKCVVAFRAAFFRRYEY